MMSMATMLISATIFIELYINCSDKCSVIIPCYIVFVSIVPGFHQWCTRMSFL